MTVDDRTAEDAVTTSADATPVTAPTASAALRGPLAAWWSRNWLLVVLVVLACLASVVIRHVVYPGYSWNRDELTYQWQVSVWQSGHLFGADGGFPDMFWPWLTGQSADGYFSQYTVGWPLVMFVADALTGSTAASILVGVIAFVLGAYAFTLELTRDRRLALLTTALAIACPMFAVQSGVYLGYLFSTGIGLLFGAALLAGIRKDDWRLTALGGAALGFLFLTRPFDAVLWGVAFGAYAVVAAWRRWRALVRAATIVAAVLVPFLVITLLYNRAITGGLTQFPFTAKEPLDTFGFGERRLMPDTPVTSYSGWEMVRGELRNALYFPDFLVGAWLGVATACAGLWLRRRDRSTLGLLAVMAMFPLGYAGFWGIRLSSYYAFLSAPLYFIPAFVPVCVLIGTVILRVWSRRGVALTAVLCGALALVTLPYTIWKLGDNQAISRANLAWKDSISRIDDDALVVVATQRFLMHLNPYSRNAAQLDNTSALYASDRRRRLLGLIAAHPERTPVLQLTNKPKLGDAFHHPHPDRPRIRLVPMEVLESRRFAITARVRATSTEPLVVSMFVAGRYETRVLSSSPIVGDTYETTFDVGLPTGGSGEGVIPLGDQPGLVAIRTAQTENLEHPFAHPFSMQWYSTRPVEGGYELLTPVRKARVTHDDGEREAREVVRTPGFRVEVAPTG